VVVSVKYASSCRDVPGMTSNDEKVGGCFSKVGQ